MDVILTSKHNDTSLNETVGITMAKIRLYEREQIKKEILQEMSMANEETQDLHETTIFEDFFAFKNC